MKTHEKQAGRRFGGDAGHILVLAAAGMLCLLVMAAAAVDVGNWYNKSNKAQRAADAASMAAVAEYTRVESSTGSVTQARAAAQTTAVAIARQNGYDTANSRITVTTAFSTLGANDSVAVTIAEHEHPAHVRGPLHPATCPSPGTPPRSWGSARPPVTARSSCPRPWGP